MSGPEGERLDAEVVASTTSHRFRSMMGSGLKGLSEKEARATSHRLRVRLGAISGSKLVSGQTLHNAVVSLGLTRYTVEVGCGLGSFRVDLSVQPSIICHRTDPVWKGCTENSSATWCNLSIVYEDTWNHEDTWSAWAKDLQLSITHGNIKGMRCSCTTDQHICFKAGIQVEAPRQRYSDIQTK